MGVDYYECKDCKQYLFDCWEQCDACSTYFGENEAHLCVECFSDEKYDKHKFTFNTIKFNLCTNCINDEDQNENYELLTKHISMYKYKKPIEEMKQTLKLIDFENLIKTQINEYYNKSEKIHELLIKINDNNDKIEILMQENIDMMNEICILNTNI